MSDFAPHTDPERLRQHFATRLHDGPVQELTAAQLFLDTAIMELREQGVVDLGDDSPLQRGAEALRAAIASTRALMREVAGEGSSP
jgi:signal transduction histidine kinase